jgi:hypothetical protein
MSENIIYHYLNVLKETVNDIVQNIEQKNQQEVKILLQDAQDQIKNLETFYYGIPDGTKRKEIQNQVSEFKVKIQEIQYDNQYNSFFSGNFLEKTNVDRLGHFPILKNSYEQVLETEEIGKDVINQLSYQKETLQKSKNNIRNVNGQMSKAVNLLRSLNKWWK